MAAPMIKVCQQVSIFSFSRLAQIRTISLSSRHCSEIKKFYKQATISQINGGLFEVNLDKLKLKTLSGNLLQIPHEALALAVATEWNNQKDVIKKHTMYMTALCNIATDNPTGRNPENIVDGIVHFLETDTVCYRVDEPVELSQVQKQLWDPLISWFADRYGVEVAPTTGFLTPNISKNSQNTLKQHLLSYGDWALFGFHSGVETLKSLIIMLAVVDKELSVETAVRLARLEHEFQIQKWGNVEWAHDLDREEMKARLASAVLFVHWCSESFTSKRKSLENH